MLGLAGPTLSTPTSIVVLQNMVTPQELAEGDAKRADCAESADCSSSLLCADYHELIGEIKEELAKYGEVKNCIGRIDKVYCEYKTEEMAQK